MYDIIKLIFAILLIFTIGRSLLKLIIIQDKTKTFLAERIALSFGLGTGALSIGMFLLSYTGFQLNLLNILLLFTPFFVYLLWREKFEIVCSGANIKSKLKDFNSLQLTLIALILFIIFLIFSDALIQPMHGWDERAFWAFKAKILYHEGTIFSTDFFDADRVHPHKRYPLLIPLVESWIYIVLGHIDDRLVKVIFPLFFTSLLLILYSSQRKFFSRTHSLIFTALLASVPCFVATLISKHNAASVGYADIPLSFFYFISVIYLYMWMMDNSNKDYLVIAAIFSAFTVFTKPEGIILFIISLFILNMYILFDLKQAKKQKIMHLLSYLIIPTVMLLPWFIFKSNLPSDIPFNFSITYFIQRLYIAPIVLTGVLKNSLNPLLWGVLWGLFWLSTLFTIKETFKKPLVYLFLILIFYISAWITIYMLRPSSVEGVEYSVFMWGNIGRRLTHIAPIMVFLISNQVYYGKLLISVRKAFKFNNKNL